MSVNIPQTANDLPCDDLAFECEQIAEQAEALFERPAFEHWREAASALRDVCRLIASTNRNMARMLSSGKASS